MLVKGKGMIEKGSKLTNLLGDPFFEPTFGLNFNQFVELLIVSDANAFFVDFEHTLDPSETAFNNIFSICRILNGKPSPTTHKDDQ